MLQVTKYNPKLNQTKKIKNLVFNIRLNPYESVYYNAFKYNFPESKFEVMA